MDLLFNHLGLDGFSMHVVMMYMIISNPSEARILLLYSMFYLATRNYLFILALRQFEFSYHCFIDRLQIHQIIVA